MASRERVSHGSSPLKFGLRIASGLPDILRTWLLRNWSAGKLRRRNIFPRDKTDWATIWKKISYVYKVPHTCTCTFNIIITVYYSRVIKLLGVQGCYSMVRMENCSLNH